MQLGDNMTDQNQKQHRFEVYFTIEERGRFKVLIDNTGKLCGAYATYRSAKEAIPNVRKKIIRQLQEEELLKESTSE
jgi:hypothetical protein